VKKTRILALAAVAAGATAAFAMAAPGAEQGPSSSQPPYIVRSQPGVVTKSILTTGDSVNSKPDGTPYRLVGIPDGLGAFDNGDGTFTVLMNHELAANRGTMRAHGAIGAFVSKWTIDKETLAVESGQDLIQTVATWNPVTKAFDPPAKGIAIGRLCSADLAAPGAFYSAASGLGYNGRLFLDGEEVGNEGRGFAHALDGRSWEVAALGKFSWENSLANPATGNETVVAGTDDSTPGQVYVYHGTKKAAGNPVEQAGLTGGTLYGIKVTGFPDESNATGIPSGTPFTLASLGNRESSTGAAIEADSNTAGVTRFLRPEDASWDPTDPSKLYFVTTNAFDRPSRLWRLNFTDPANPAAGGTIDMVLDGTEGQHMFDNITVNDRGQVLLEEDPGNQAYVAKVWRYYPDTDSLVEIAHFDENLFTPGGPGFITQDEESSGIIPAPFLGEDMYLFDAQVHLGSSDPELVEGGQLLALHIPPGEKAK
jgi:hypothetical protein